MPLKVAEPKILGYLSVFSRLKEKASRIRRSNIRPAFTKRPLESITADTKNHTVECLAFHEQPKLAYVLVNSNRCIAEFWYMERPDITHSTAMVTKLTSKRTTAYCQGLFFALVEGEMELGRGWLQHI